MNNIQAINEAVSIAGSQAKLGKAVGAHRSYVNQWVNDVKPVEAFAAMHIEVLYGIKAPELCPSKDWSIAKQWAALQGEAHKNPEVNV